MLSGCGGARGVRGGDNRSSEYLELRSTVVVVTGRLLGAALALCVTLLWIGSGCFGRG